MEHNRNKGFELRQIIAAAVGGDPEKYNEKFLGRPNEAYCTWILDPKKWGVARRGLQVAVGEGFRGHVWWLGIHARDGAPTSRSDKFYPFILANYDSHGHKEEIGKIKVSSKMNHSAIPVEQILQIPPKFDQGPAQQINWLQYLKSPIVQLRTLTE